MKKPTNKINFNFLKVISPDISRIKEVTEDSLRKVKQSLYPLLYDGNTIFYPNFCLSSFDKFFSLAINITKIAQIVINAPI